MHCVLWGWSGGSCLLYCLWTCWLCRQSASCLLTLETADQHSTSGQMENESCLEGLQGLCFLKSINICVHDGESFLCSGGGRSLWRGQLRKGPGPCCGRAGGLELKDGVTAYGVRIVSLSLKVTVKLIYAVGQARFTINVGEYKLVVCGLLDRFPDKNRVMAENCCFCSFSQYRCLTSLIILLNLYLDSEKPVSVPLLNAPSLSNFSCLSLAVNQDLLL